MRHRVFFFRDSKGNQISHSFNFSRLSSFAVIALASLSAFSLALAQPADLPPDDADISFKSYLNTSLRKSQNFELDEVRRDLLSPDFASVKTWIAANDEYVEIILKGLKASKQKKLDAALTGIVDIPLSSKKAALVPDLTVDEIYDKYAPILAALPPIPAAAPHPGDVELYLKAYRESARQYANGAIDVAFKNKRIDPHQAARLCLTTSLVCFTDENWTDEVSTLQPDWMKNKDLAFTAENYCLYLKRYRTAYSLNKSLLAPRAASTSQLSFIDYLESASRLRLEQKDVTPAYQCAIAALKEADLIRDNPAKVRLTLLTAEIQSFAGNDQIAADLAKGILPRATAPEDRLRAMLLRLKFLFQDGQYKDLLNDVAAYKADPAASPVMDRFLYMEWLTLVRLNKDQEAKSIGDKITRDFSNSQFASEIRYHNAVQFLAQGKYDDASKELEIIEQRYSDSPAAKQAKQIRASLDKARKPKT